MTSFDYVCMKCYPIGYNLYIYSLYAINSKIVLDKNIRIWYNILVNLVTTSFKNEKYFPSNQLEGELATASLRLGDD